MPDKKGGFTLIELLVVISIIMLLASMTAIGLVIIPYQVKKAATRTEISAIAMALEEYHIDYGAYPADDPDNSSRKLVDALTGDRKADPPRKNYYSFSKSRLINGVYFSLFKEPFYYRRNESENDKTDDMKNPYTYDIWTSDGKKTGQSVNNWTQ